MKILLTAAIFLMTPLIFLFALLYVFVPLLIQRLFPVRTLGNYKEYPYQTSWEEAA